MYPLRNIIPLQVPEGLLPVYLFAQDRVTEICIYLVLFIHVMANAFCYTRDAYYLKQQLLKIVVLYMY